MVIYKKRKKRRRRIHNKGKQKSLKKNLMRLSVSNISNSYCIDESHFAIHWKVGEGALEDRLK